VFVKIWNRIDTYDATKGKLFTWLLNVARNSAIDQLRSLQYKQSLKNQKMDESVGVIDKSQSDVSNVDTIGLRDVVSKLAPEYKMLIEFAYFKGYTQDEIAKEFNIPLGTVKTRTRSALNQLRQLLEIKTN
jgi:RNA polymerase sigma-70 factor (ECF subfamily)